MRNALWSIAHSSIPVFLALLAGSASIAAAGEKGVLFVFPLAAWGVLYLGALGFR